MTQPTSMSDSGSGGAAQSMTPALLLGMAGFLTNFDVTAVVIALPAVARELGLDVAGYAWVMDAYSLAFTACLLFAGALADRYGRRRALLVGNGIFALASLACGMAWDGPTLLVARALQGIGAAFIVTGGFALIASVYVQTRARTDAFALVGVMSGVAMAFGPTMGGLVSSWIGWRWIFLINLPVCALVAWGVPRLVAEAREAVPRPLDPLGVVYLRAYCACRGAAAWPHVDVTYGGGSRAECDVSGCIRPTAEKPRQPDPRSRHIRPAGHDRNCDLAVRRVDRLLGDPRLFATVLCCGL